AAALAGLAWALLRRGDAATRRWGRALALLLALQLATGLSNVVLGWPLPAALIHTAGAAALVLLLTLLWLRGGARAAAGA
ncbi:MAG: COX15/CtaA family protein, partial [Burkholderiales bacterium]|nr:COX15/CtaA family protein [Burkholderiales bacterium]